MSKRRKPQRPKVRVETKAAVDTDNPDVHSPLQAMYCAMEWCTGARMALEGVESLRKSADASVHNPEKFNSTREEIQASIEQYDITIRVLKQMQDTALDSLTSVYESVVDHTIDETASKTLAEAKRRAANQ